MPRRSTGQIAADLKPAYGAPTPEAASAAFEEFEEKWGKTYPAVAQLWRNAWVQFTPFLDYGVEIRKVLCSTDAIESMNARYRRTVPVRGTEQAALKYLYLVTRSLDPNGAESDTVDHALEASTEGLRGHLRRPDAKGRGQLNLKMEAAAYTGFLTDP